MGTVLVIGGPTAAGKTRLALEMACRYGAALVSADAMQVYRRFDIGTAKPPSYVLRRYPHACVDVREAGEDFSVQDFLAEVVAARRTHERVVVVGGTPFYLRALLRPLAEMPAADAAVRARLEALPDLHARLLAVDPASAARLHPNDRVRLVRALEVHELTGQPLSSVHVERARPSVEGVHLCWLDREDLRPRIHARLQRMVERGYLEEVEALVAAGIGRDTRPMQSFAYKHLVAWVQGEISREQALYWTERDTWTFARKQRTFARGQGWRGCEVGEVREVARRLWGAGGL